MTAAECEHEHKGGRVRLSRKDLGQRCSTAIKFYGLAWMFQLGAMIHGSDTGAEAKADIWPP